MAVAGLAAGQANAQDRDVRTITRETPSGAVVTRRVVRDEPYREHYREDSGWRHGEHYGWRHEHEMRRTVVIHHREYPMRHVVVRTVHHHPAYVVNRHVTVIHNQG
jgi:hypothetical protein